MLIKGHVITKIGSVERILKFAIDQKKGETSMYCKIESNKRVKLPNPLSNLYEIIMYTLEETFPGETIDRILLI